MRGRFFSDMLWIWRGKGSLTMRHLVVAVLVVVVVNAQLTWWIVFVLRENRTRLELERGAVESLCRIEAERIEQSVSAVQQMLEAAVGATVETAPHLPMPLTTWWLEDEAGDHVRRARLEGGAVAMSTISPDSPGCLWAVPRPSGPRTCSRSTRPSRSCLRPKQTRPAPDRRWSCPPRLTKTPSDLGKISGTRSSAGTAAAF